MTANLLTAQLTLRVAHWYTSHGGPLPRNDKATRRRLVIASTGKAGSGSAVPGTFPTEHSVVALRS